MRIIATSDLHGNLIPPEKINGLKPDVFIVAGDVCPLMDHTPYFQECWMKSAFHPWLDQIKAKKIYIGGNHDWALSKKYFRNHIKADAEINYDDITYLEDEGCEIDGIKFWGSPWANRIVIDGVYCPWPFCADEIFLAKKWAMIPKDTDVLITHGPPYGIGDAVPRKNPDDTQWPLIENVGSRGLLASVLAIQPRVHIFGHIHCSYGQYKIGNTLCANVAFLNDDYVPTNELVEFNI